MAIVQVALALRQRFNQINYQQIVYPANDGINIQPQSRHHIYSRRTITEYSCNMIGRLNNEVNGLEERELYLLALANVLDQLPGGNFAAQGGIPEVINWVTFVNYMVDNRFNEMVEQDHVIDALTSMLCWQQWNLVQAPPIPQPQNPNFDPIAANLRHQVEQDLPLLNAAGLNDETILQRANRPLVIANQI